MNAYNECISKTPHPENADENPCHQCAAKMTSIIFYIFLAEKQKLPIS